MFQELAIAHKVADGAPISQRKMLYLLLDILVPDAVLEPGGCEGKNTCFRIYLATGEQEIERFSSVEVLISKGVYIDFVPQLCEISISF